MPENPSKFKIKKEGGNFYHPEVTELERPLQILLKEMLGNIEKGEYDLIIGIDSSGRIPTLIVSKFIRHIYSNKGLPPQDTRFVAGNISKENAEEKIKEWNPQKKVLIIEDTISTGDSIRFLCQALRELKISFDIATVGNLGVYSDTSELTERLKDTLGVKHIYFGTAKSPNIYTRRYLSGVQKEHGDTFSRRYKKIKRENDNMPLHVQETINQARADADIVADHLIDWYESRTN